MRTLADHERDLTPFLQSEQRLLMKMGLDNPDTYWHLATAGHRDYVVSDLRGTTTDLELSAARRRVH